jgi:serine phosphatase RsbU (regulator of sigma subunit)
VCPHSDAADPAAPAPPVEPVPTVFPTIDGADIAAVFVGRRLAGDFYDSIRTSSGRILIGMLDVAGRREENRCILLAAQQIFRTAGTRLFSPPDINESNAMTELCLDMNRGLLEVCGGPRSCPAFLACYQEKLGTLCYTNAGHTSGLLRDQTGITELPSTGLPLGLFSHATCEAPTVGVEKQASLLLVSRGVVDTEGNDSAGVFGLDRLKQLFLNESGLGAQALCTAVLNSVAEFTGNAPASDDRTALAMVRAQQTTPGASSGFERTGAGVLAGTRGGAKRVK